jgi:SAM-dependent methyltransferase
MARSTDRLFSYRAVERVLVQERPDAMVLDLGCSDGENLGYLVPPARRAVGVDPSHARLQRINGRYPVAVAIGEELPIASRSIDLVYISHVLHHARDHRAVLGEVARILRPGGAVLLMETFDDSPAMRAARRLRPEYDHDPVTCRFRFDEMRRDLSACGFAIDYCEQYNVFYWAWEFAAQRFKPLWRFDPLMIETERRLSRWLPRVAAHGYFLAHLPGEPRFDLARAVSAATAPAALPARH